MGMGIHIRNTRPGSAERDFFWGNGIGNITFSPFPLPIPLLLFMYMPVCTRINVAKFFFVSIPIRRKVSFSFNHFEVFLFLPFYEIVWGKELLFLDFHHWFPLLPTRSTPTRTRTFSFHKTFCKWFFFVGVKLSSFSPLYGYGLTLM